jgi:hypothetical protein
MRWRRCGPSMRRIAAMVSRVCCGGRRGGGEGVSCGVVMARVRVCAHGSSTAAGVLSVHATRVWWRWRHCTGVRAVRGHGVCLHPRAPPTPALAALGAIRPQASLCTFWEYVLAGRLESGAAMAPMRPIYRGCGPSIGDAPDRGLGVLWGGMCVVGCVPCGVVATARVRVRAWRRCLVRAVRTGGEGGVGGWGCGVAIVGMRAPLLCGGPHPHTSTHIHATKLKSPPPLHSPLGECRGGMLLLRLDGSYPGWL